MAAPAQTGKGVVMYYAMVIGALAGLLIGADRAGWLRRWSKPDPQVPAPFRLFLVFGLGAVAANEAQSTSQAILFALAAIGTAKSADLLVQTLALGIDEVRGR